jgi:NADPH-dependent 2,4-dienoyl-CoA reductase/sulfur reductase-like enzyme
MAEAASTASAAAAPTRPPSSTASRRRARRSCTAFDALKRRADWRPHLVWNIVPHQRELRTLRGGGHDKVPYDAAILCTGAMDRVVPIPGWTGAGVTTLGGAQIALKTQGCAIGTRVAFVGTGPLLWLVAYQYAKAGASVAAVLDTTPFATKAAQAFGLVRGGATLAKGLYYTGWLRAHGIPIDEGITPVAIDAHGQEVTGIRWRTARNEERRIGCDAVAMGWGLRPEARLPTLPAHRSGSTACSTIGCQA